MILNDIFTLPTSRPDLEVCTKFGAPGVFAGPTSSSLLASRLSRSIEYVHSSLVGKMLDGRQSLLATLVLQSLSHE